MADTIGPQIRRMRQTKGLNQADFYAELLSPRQAIRFENGENAPRMDLLLPMIARLGLTPNEFAQQLTHGQPASPVRPQVTAMALAAIAKLEQWPDWQLTDAEQAAIKAYALAASALSVRDIRHLVTASWLFAPAIGDTLRDRLWRDLQVYQGLPEFTAAAADLWTARGFDYATRNQVADARAAFTRVRALAGPIGFPALNSQFYLTLLQPQLGAVALVAQTQPLIVGLWTMGAQWLADALMDNRRHVLSAMGLHPRWRREELGALARLRQANPKGATPNEAAYYRDELFPGLSQGLAEWGGTLSDYLTVPPQPLATGD